MVRLEIPDTDFRIERISFDYAINFYIGRPYELKVETEFTLEVPGAETITINPEDPGDSAPRILSLLHREVERIEYDTSSLWMDVQGGFRVFVPNDLCGDAWTLSP